MIEVQARIVPNLDEDFLLWIVLATAGHRLCHGSGITQGQRELLELIIEQGVGFIPRFEIHPSRGSEASDE
jgi:hypothetical protein